jgi:transposase
MIEEKLIRDALEKHWNIGPAAKELGIGYSTLRKYINYYKIEHNSRKSKNGPKFNKKAHQAAAVTRARQKKKIEALNYKGGMKCTRCGFDEQIPDVYAFHHRNPDSKDPSWGKMKTNNWSLEKIKEELDKCDVLCHNCHSIVHYLERQNDPE